MSNSVSNNDLVRDIRGIIPAVLDVSGIQLPGEEDGTVPVFDTCDTVRRRIKAFLKSPAVTQAAYVARRTRSRGVGGAWLLGTAGKSTRSRTGRCTRRFVFPSVGQARLYYGECIARRHGDRGGPRVTVLSV